MRICWWLLVTVHLVWCSSDHLEDLYEGENTINTQSNTINNDDLADESGHETDLHDDSAANYPRIKRNAKQDEREKKQQKFHSWGGKRYGEEEDGDNGENINTDHDYLNQEEPEQYLTFGPIQSSNLSNSEDIEDSQDVRSKRSQSSPAFSSWAGKRTPEVVNEAVKRSILYSSLLNNEAFATTKGDLGMKRYPSFNSWAGKRSAAFNSWGGKRGPAAFNSWGGKRSAAFNSWGGKRGPAAFNSWGGKRAAAFNSWGGKRGPTAFNSWGGKRTAAFNSWGGKRAAAFNSWGGKRDAAFKSWGGKRASAFNSWGGKRSPAAFNSWGGKRAAAFNSWGGKRAAAFNSWGGKRAAAFNSWGGKRDSSDISEDVNKGTSLIGNLKDTNLGDDFDANENSKDATSYNLKTSNWDHTLDSLNKEDVNIENEKRTAAFNSWGGKRSFADGSSINDEMRETNLLPQFQSGMLIKYEYNDPDAFDTSNLEALKVPLNTENEENSILKLNEISLKNYINFSKALHDQHIVPTFHENDDRNSYLPNSEEENVFKGKRVSSDSLSPNIEHIEEFPENSNDEHMEKRERPFSSWAGKRSPLFSSWYGNKIPTMLLSSGKRRPALSSWGGKRSVPIEESNQTPPSEGCTITNILKYGINCHKVDELEENEENENKVDSEEEKVYERKKREIDCDANNFMFTDRKGGCRDKRGMESVKKNRIITRMYLQGGLTWPLTFKSLPRTMDFYAWGGKRSL